MKPFSAESYEMRAAKRRKAKKVAQRRYEEERMAALEMEAAAAAGGSRAEDAAEHMSAIQVTWDENLLQCAVRAVKGSNLQLSCNLITNKSLKLEPRLLLTRRCWTY